VHLIATLIVQLSSFASILGLYFTVLPLSNERPNWHWAMIIAFSALSIFLAFKEIRLKMQERHRKFRNTAAVNRYMCKWISQQGRTVIFSRDLSWGDEYNSKTALMKKARAGDLKIFLHQKTALSDALEGEGAEIVVYGETDHEPKSRFTIVGFGKEGARLAVGTQRGGKPIVYEFESGEDPVFALAEDYAKLLSKVCV
jgi:hypothetical protein